MKLIKVTGKGNISVKPDTTIVEVNMRGFTRTYEESVAKSSEDLSKLRNAIESIGLDRSSLSTNYYSIEPHYKEIRLDDHRESIFDGYEYHQGLHIKFPVDNKTLGKVLVAIQSVDAKQSAHIMFTLSNSEEAKNKLLANAVQDAITKAHILADSAHIKLGEIQNIDYSFQTVEFTTDENMFMCCDTKSSDLNIDVDPENIEKIDAVTITFAIE